MKLDNDVGSDTFGFERYLNQKFYKSPEWKKIRRDIILRDNACDLAMEGYEMNNYIYIHHLNPLRPNDVINRTEYLTNPEFLVCTSLGTHNVIHYGSVEAYIQKQTVVERRPNDTCPWKH